MAAPGDTAPVRGSRYQPGTLRRAGLLAVMMLIVLGFVANLLTSQTRRSPLQELVRLGERVAPERLRQDLLALSPIGGDPGPAVQRLSSMGFSCIAPAEAVGAWTCTARIPDPDRRLITFEAKLDTDRGIVRAVTTRASIQTTM
ncbi:hypothetical protein EOD42_14675 [Rhodovarius crocodyli]|uniref:DUF4333 domain-containing protein n=1 Tax=Rhodovarius crocodyli TaxID=1979269 RepID=A0A437MFC3_9PROT|nr:hypothetical protein [Rhodovarius crocodyli]RVT96348.1 hypothetical protein EOD42_14675 [Rhodovarius crocodyli]